MTTHATAMDDDLMYGSQPNGDLERQKPDLSGTDLLANVSACGRNQ
jgi:hypothetical protein